ncbi:MAG: DEAD/DEAH box helicase [Planctomycetota bacterium]
MEFTELPLAEPLLRAVADQGYATASPIQAQTIPQTLAGRDVLGCAQTGTGKTAAFALPTLHRLHTVAATGKKYKAVARPPRCLVLAPTRELAGQIADSFRDYGRHTDVTHMVVYGGVNQNPQVARLQAGVDVVIATPGRLLDLMEQGHVDLSRIEVFILDEADRMLDMGFIPDIRKINRRVPKKRQTLLFSATMSPAIEKLARDLMRDPVKIDTAPQSTTADGVEQALYFVDKPHKPQMLIHLLNELSISRAIVFTRTKYGADKLLKKLRRADIPAEAIHGNKTQNARQRSLDRFKSGQCHILLATDIASRGIDVDNVSHVFNYDLPDDPESYVHRIGRTARAGATGLAIAFCDQNERANLTAVQRLIRMRVPVLTDFPEDIPEGAGAKLPDDTPRPKKPQRGGGRGGQKPRRGQSATSKAAPKKKTAAQKRKPSKNRRSQPGQGGKPSSTRNPKRKPPRRGPK